jgi:hypothetical protein
MSLIQAYEVVQGGIARPTPADVRLDAMLISPHIDTALYRWVVPTLSQGLYDALVTDKGSSSAFTSTAYQALWDAHLKSLCANASLYEAAPFIVIQAGSNGLYLNNNEYGQNAGVEGLKFYQDTLKQRLEISAKRLKDYLCANAASLSPFDAAAAGCPDADCKPEQEDYYNTIGLVI